MATAIKKFVPIETEEETPKPVAVQEEERMTQMRNEKTRLEKEIDILRIRYDDRQRMFQAQERDFQQKVRVDQDTIMKQLVENKAKAERLEKTQSEVNQLRAQIEESAKKQKDLLLRKEVELDQALKKVQEERAEIAARLPKRT